MLYAVDSGRVLDGDITMLTDEQKLQAGYQFVKSDIVSEAEMFRRFKKEMFTEKHRVDILNKNNLDDGFGVTSRLSPNGSSVVPSTPFGRKAYTGYPIRGYYLIPKLYNYFPFLDCDSTREFDDCCVELNMNDVPFVGYQSNKYGSCWIFCDRQGSFEKTLKFIEAYPCDPRYAWVAGYKKEFCVRATTKHNFTPKRITDIADDMTDDFKYWLSCFENHWSDGMIEKYRMIHDTMESL